MRLVHKHFQLNGIPFSSAEELIEQSNQISKSLHSFLTDWFSSSETVIVRTSGSTGKPKDIELKKKFMVNSARATGEFFNLTKETTALCCLPIDYIAGKMMIVRALTLGWHIDVIEPTSHPLKEITRSYDFSAMVPLQLRNSLDQLQLIDKLIVGGGAVAADLEQSLQGLSTKIYATYGMTETITHIAVKLLNTQATSDAYFQVLPDISISTDDRDCLIIHAPTISDDKVITNDIVEIISENTFVWKGRFDHVINSGGIKLHPEEIEKKLSNHISARFFVAGIQDEKLGQKLVLLVEGDPFPIDLKKVTSLTKYEVPKEIIFIPQFLETDTGKIQRTRTLESLRF